jgi:hypothetical protein
MALPYDQTISGRAISNQVENQPGWDRLMGGRTPLWYWRMISAALLLLNGESPQYVTGSLDEGTGKALIFGADIVVTVDVIGPLNDSATFTVAAVSRAGLTSLQATASLSVGQEGFGRWPGVVELIATYADGRVWTLPMVPSKVAELDERLEAFIPSILADLRV